MVQCHKATKKTDISLFLLSYIIIIIIIIQHSIDKQKNISNTQNKIDKATIGVFFQRMAQFIVLWFLCSINYAWCHMRLYIIHRIFLKFGANSFVQYFLWIETRPRSSFIVPHVEYASIFAMPVVSGIKLYTSFVVSLLRNFSCKFVEMNS